MLSIIFLMLSLKDNWRKQCFTHEVRIIKRCGIQVGIESKTSKKTEWFYKPQVIEIKGTQWKLRWGNTLKHSVWIFQQTWWRKQNFRCNLICHNWTYQYMSDHKRREHFPFNYKVIITLDFIKSLEEDTLGKFSLNSTLQISILYTLCLLAVL